MCTHTLWLSPFYDRIFSTLQTVTLSLGKAGVKPSCLVQNDTHDLRSTVRAADFYVLYSVTDDLSYRCLFYT